MIPSLFGFIDLLFKIKDFKDLLAQERLKAMIEFLETVGGVHIKTAIEEIMAAQYSTWPEEECSRAIGQLKVAANALLESLRKRPFLTRFVRNDEERQMRTHFQIMGCYLIIASLYGVQRNMVLAGQYAAEASKAFTTYAVIRRHRLSRALFRQFTYNGGTDQAPLICFVDNDRLRGLMAHYGVHHSIVDENTLHQLAMKMIGSERERLFGWMRPLGIQS